MLRITVIILNFNAQADTLACLQSLLRSDYPHFRILVLDNGSQDGSAHAIRTAHPQIELLEIFPNKGFAGGVNIALQHALKGDGEWFLLLNNDTEVTPHFLSAFASYVEKHPHMGAVAGAPYLFNERNTLDHIGGMWNKKKGQFDLIGFRCKQADALFHALPQLDYLYGCALMIRRQALENVGLFEPSFFLCWEEADLCMRIRKSGFSLGVCKEAVLYHKVSASFVGGKPQTNYYWWRNRLLFMERNLSKKEFLASLFLIALPEMVHHFKITLLKTLQLFVGSLIKASETKQRERRQKRDNAKAALCGITHYFCRRFGKGPDWIHGKKYTARRKVW